MASETAEMNSKSFGLRVAAVIFALFALVHLWRLLSRWEVLIAGYPMPLWGSLIALLVAGGLSLWLWKLASAARG
jgi:hypothetical protein